MTRNILITLFRNDLRLHDNQLFAPFLPNPTKHSFAREVTHVLPVYVYDEKYVELRGIPGYQTSNDGEARTRTLGIWRCGEHRVKYLNTSVFDLRERLRKVQSDLSMWAGSTEAVVPAIVKALQAQGDSVEGVWATHEIGTEEAQTENRLSSALQPLGVGLKLFHQKTLVHPKSLPFTYQNLPDVYTHFRKSAEGLGLHPGDNMFSLPLPAPKHLPPFPPVQGVKDTESVFALQKDGLDSKDSLVDKLLAPLRQDPVLGISVAEGKSATSTDLNAFAFKGGETEALSRLAHYFGFDDEKGSASPELAKPSTESPAARYKETRNGMLGIDYSTKFAGPLSLGLLSPRLIATKALELDGLTSSDKGGGYWIVFELLWRDYFTFVAEKFGSALFKLDGIESCLQPRAAAQKVNNWLAPETLGVGGGLDVEKDADDGFVRWATARTGVPLIDANMRELVETGFMSNRGRQNVASFLTKDLGYDWRLGAEFFESFLVDYDPGSNWGNWQYVAGVGNDPRSSRQFNPIKQGNDYDSDAKYIKAWLPQLATLPPSVAHAPWTLPAGQRPADYPERPVIENPTWRKFYPGGGSAGHSGSGGRGRGRGRGKGRGGGGRGGGNGRN